jgi:hypothetical protein
LGHKNTNVPLILKVLEIIFGVFRGGFAQDNLGVKKVSAPLKNPAKCLIICFAREKKTISRIFKIIGTLIVKKPFSGS